MAVDERNRRSACWLQSLPKSESLALLTSGHVRWNREFITPLRDVYNVHLLRQAYRSALKRPDGKAIETSSVTNDT